MQSHRRIKFLWTSERAKSAEIWSLSAPCSSFLMSAERYCARFATCGRTANPALDAESIQAWKDHLDIFNDSELENHDIKQFDRRLYFFDPSKTSIKSIAETIMDSKEAGRIKFMQELKMKRKVFNFENKSKLLSTWTRRRVAADINNKLLTEHIAMSNFGA